MYENWNLRDCQVNICPELWLDLLGVSLLFFSSLDARPGSCHHLQLRKLIRKWRDNLCSQFPSQMTARASTRRHSMPLTGPTVAGYPMDLSRLNQIFVDPFIFYTVSQKNTLCLATTPRVIFAGHRVDTYFVLITGCHAEMWPKPD